MDRYWFFTWRTYGTWLPGEDGFVSYYRNLEGQRVIDNLPGESATGAIPALERYAREAMHGEPVALTVSQAEILLVQFHETAAHRRWAIDAVAVLVNHIHIVYGVGGDPEPEAMLRDWKSYASRALNRAGNVSGRWWADRGSQRPLKTPDRRRAAIRYVRDQENPLVLWLSAEARAVLAEPAE